MAFTAASWSYHLELEGLAPSAMLSDFTAVISEGAVNAAFWASVADGGGDIRVATDADGVNQLALEVIRCDTGSEALQVWVKLPVYSTALRTVHLFAGNSGQAQPAITAAYGSNEVWSSVIGKWHNAGGTNSVDGVFKTPQSLVGSVGDVATAPLGAGTDYQNTSRCVDMAIQPELGVTDDFFWSGWVYPVADNSGVLFGNRYDGGSSPLSFCKLTAGGFEYYIGGNQGVGYDLPIDDWSRVYIAKRGATLEYYVDGVSVGTSTVTSVMPANSFNAAAASTGQESTNAVLEGLSIGSVARSSAHAASDYANQSNLLAFWSEAAAPSGHTGAISTSGAGDSIAAQGVLQLPGALLGNPGGDTAEVIGGTLAAAVAGILNANTFSDISMTQGAISFAGGVAATSTASTLSAQSTLNLVGSIPAQSPISSKVEATGDLRFDGSLAASSDDSTMSAASVATAMATGALSAQSPISSTLEATGVLRFGGSFSVGASVSVFSVPLSNVYASGALVANNIMTPLIGEINVTLIRS